MIEPKRDMDESEPFVLEEPRPLSQSLLWKIQRNFFRQHGAAAWGEHIVPFYITTNPFIANAYAQVVLGFLRDCHFATSVGTTDSFGTLDPSQPVYVIELGSGAGRLGFHFLKRFTDLYRRSDIHDFSIKYIMTDLAEKNFAFWESQPALSPFVEAGLLDFAVFDAENPGPLALEHSREVLAPGAVNNPIVVLANYFFDSIPQDAFYIEDGQLFASYLKLSSAQPEPDLNDSELIKRLTLVYNREPTRPDYYDDPEFNQILKNYCGCLDRTALDFPNVALECLRYFRQLGKERLLVLSGDKGYDRIEELAGRQEPGYATHGSFSMMVNYHAIEQYIMNRGGRVLATSYRYAGLNIIGLLLGEPPDKYARTREAFHTAIEQAGPDDFFSLSQALTPHLASMNLEQILAYLRMSGSDSHVFSNCFPILLEQAGSAADKLGHELKQAINQVWANYYHLGEAEDLPFNLGSLLYRIGEYDGALGFFGHSLRLYGPAATTFYNSALCHYRLRHFKRALELLAQALTLDPGLEVAQKLQRTVQTELQKKPADE